MFELGSIAIQIWKSDDGMLWGHVTFESSWNLQIWCINSMELEWNPSCFQYVFNPSWDNAPRRAYLSGGALRSQPVRRLPSHQVPRHPDGACHFCMKNVWYGTNASKSSKWAGLWLRCSYLFRLCYQSLGYQSGCGTWCRILWYLSLPQGILRQAAMLGDFLCPGGSEQNGLSAHLWIHKFITFHIICSQLKWHCLVSNPIFRQNRRCFRSMSPTFWVAWVQRCARSRAVWLQGQSLVKAQAIEFRPGCPRFSNQVDG